MRVVHATYQNGVFAPEQPVELPEGAQVKLWIDPPWVEVDKLGTDDRAFLTRLAQERAEVFRRLAE